MGREGCHWGGGNSRENSSGAAGGTRRHTVYRIGKLQGSKINWFLTAPKTKVSLPKGRVRAGGEEGPGTQKEAWGLGWKR